MRRKYVPKNLAATAPFSPPRIRASMQVLLGALAELASEPPPDKAKMIARNAFDRFQEVAGERLYETAISAGALQKIRDDRKERGDDPERLVMTAEEFRTLLAISGITKVDLARRLGINQPSVTRWAQGKEKIPARHVPEIRRFLQAA